MGCSIIDDIDNGMSLSKEVKRENVQQMQMQVTPPTSFPIRPAQGKFDAIGLPQEGV
jgi:hypothetical protein